MATPELSNNELADRLLCIRQINQACAEGRMSWQTRCALHNALVPQIGSLESVKPGHHKPDKTPREKRHRLSLP